MNEVKLKSYKKPEFQLIRLRALNLLNTVSIEDFDLYGDIEGFE